MEKTSLENNGRNIVSLFPTIPESTRKFFEEQNKLREKERFARRARLCDQYGISILAPTQFDENDKPFVHPFIIGGGL